MRGKPERQLAMLSSLSTEDLIPADHPIRRIRKVVEDVLAELDGEFDAMYSRIGRPSIPPEQLLKATVLMALYSLRSERAFCERLNYDLLFKWFLDLPIDAKAFDPSTFTKNRRRLLEAEIADRFFATVVKQAQLRRYVSSEHFSVDGTCWRRGRAQELQAKDGCGDGQRQVRAATPRCSGTASAAATTPRLDDRSRVEAVWQEPQHRGDAVLLGASADGAPQRLIVDAELTTADGYAERAPHRHARPPPQAGRRRTVAGDKGYDTEGSSPRPATSASPRTSPRTTPGNAPPSTGAPPATPVTRPACDPETDRGTLRVDQDRRRRPQAPLHRPPTQPGLVQDHRGGLQPASHHDPRRRCSDISSADPRGNEPTAANKPTNKEATTAS